MVYIGLIMLDMSGDDNNLSVFFIPSILIVCVFVIFYIALIIISHIYEKYYDRPDRTTPFSLSLYPTPKTSSTLFDTKKNVIGIVTGDNDASRDEINVIDNLFLNKPDDVFNNEETCIDDNIIECDEENDISSQNISM